MPKSPDNKSTNSVAPGFSATSEQGVALELLDKIGTYVNTVDDPNTFTTSTRVYGFTADYAPVLALFRYLIVGNVISLKSYYPLRGRKHIIRFWIINGMYNKWDFILKPYDVPTMAEKEQCERIELAQEWFEDPTLEQYILGIADRFNILLAKLTMYGLVNLEIFFDRNNQLQTRLLTLQIKRLPQDIKDESFRAFLITRSFVSTNEQYYRSFGKGKDIPFLHVFLALFKQVFTDSKSGIALDLDLTHSNVDPATKTPYLLFYFVYDHIGEYFKTHPDEAAVFLNREDLQPSSQPVTPKSSSLPPEKHISDNTLASKPDLESRKNNVSNTILTLIKDRFPDATILNIEFRSSIFKGISFERNDPNATLYTQEGITPQDYYDFYQYFKVNNTYFWLIDLKNQNMTENHIFKNTSYAGRTVFKKIGFLEKIFSIDGIIDSWHIKLGNLVSKDASKKLGGTFILFKLKEEKIIDDFLIKKFREYDLLPPNKPQVLLDIEKELGHSIDDQLATLLINANITGKDSLKLILAHVNVMLDSELATPPDNNQARNIAIYPLKKTTKDSIIIRMLDLIAKNINSVQDRDLKDYNVSMNDLLKNTYLLHVKIADQEIRVFDYFLDKKVIFFKSEMSTGTRGGKWSYRFYVLNGQTYTLNNKVYIAGQTDTDTIITDNLVYEAFQSFHIEDKQILDIAVEALNKAESIFRNEINSLEINAYYKSTTIKGRLLEIINYIGNYIIKTPLENLNIISRSIIFSNAKSIQGTLLKYLLENNIILIMRKKLEHKIHPLQYYLINGQNDPYPQLKVFNRLPVILNVIKDSSIGISIHKIHIKTHFIYDLIIENINILLKYQIIFMSPENSLYYFPTIKERIVNYFTQGIYETDLIQADIIRTLILVDSIFDNNLDITGLATITILPEIFIEYNKMYDISNAIEQLILDGDIQINEDSGSYDILRNNINPLLGLIPHPRNGKNKQGKHPDLTELSHILDSEFSYNMKVIQLLQYLQQTHREKKPPPSLQDISTDINLADLRQIRNHNRYNLGQHLFDHGIIYKYKESSTPIFHYAINPKITNVVDKFLEKVVNNSILDFGFGFHTYHLAFNYLLTILIDYRQHYSSVNIEKLAHLLTLIPDMEVIRHGLEITQNSVVAIMDITIPYFNSIDLNDRTPENILFDMCNQIKQSGKFDKHSFGQKSGVITIDFREFHCRNKNNAHQAIRDFVTILTWNHPSQREPLFTKAMNKSIAFNLMQNPTEAQLAYYMENFWSVFAEDLYNDDPTLMLKTVNLILRYCDGGEITIDETNGYVSVVPSNTSSYNTKFYEYIIEGISIQHKDIIVPDIEIDGQNYSKKNLIDLLIAYIVTSTTSSVDMLGDPLTPGDKIGSSAFNGKTGEYHLSGHSDSARRPPKNWLHLSAFVDRLFGDDWWIPAEFKGLVGLFNIEFKNAHSRHIISEPQINYLLGNVDTNSVSAYETMKIILAKRINTEYSPRNNRIVAYQIVKKYEKSTLNIQSPEFHKLIFYILGILGGKHRSIVIFSHPMEYINEEISDINNSSLIKRSINTIAICPISLNVYKAIESFQKALKVFYEGKGSNIELEQLFKYIGIKSIPHETNPQLITIDSVEENFLGKLVTYLNYPHSKFNYFNNTLVNKYT